MIAPGEVIDGDTIDYLRSGRESGMYISGVSDSTLQTLKVVSSGSR